MAQIIIALTALCSSIILYGVGVLGEKHPELIAGFKWSSTPEGIELDKLCLKRFHKTMTLASIATLIGGLIGILFIKNGLLVCLLISLPTLISLIYLSNLRSRIEHNKNKTNHT